MRQLIAIAIIIASLAACKERVIELFPEDAEPALADATEPADTGSPNDSGVHEDAAVIAGDAETIEDAEPAPDAAEPPDSGTSCACRYTPCRTDLECRTAIDMTSTCDTTLFFCTGSAGMCFTNADCRSGYTCTLDERSTAPCP